MEASRLPELLMLVLGLGVLVVESAGVALLYELLRHPSPRSPGQRRRRSGAASQGPSVGASSSWEDRVLIAGVIGLQVVVGLAAIATYVALSKTI